MLDINFKKMMKYLLAGFFVFAVSSILYATDSYAVFENLVSTGSELFMGMRKIIFATAGFGIMAVVVGALFGVLNWKWLSAIVIGVVVIATTGGILNYLSADTGAKKTDIVTISDTLK